MSTMLPYVFWIDHVFARRKFLELAFEKQKQIKLYTLEKATDLAFRYEELSPLAVVINAVDLVQMGERERGFIREQNIKLIQVVDHEQIADPNFRAQTLGQLTYQLDPQSSVQHLLQFLKPIMIK